MNTVRAAGLSCLAIGMLCGSAEAGVGVNENTGEARYSYDILVPAARGKYQPSVSLQYGTGNRTDYGYGFGWAASTGDWIEADPGGGLVYVHNGVRRRLVLSQYRGSVRAEIEDDDVHMNFVIGCAWIRADDAAGNHYEFSGGDNLCHGNYYLSTVVDLDGNTTLFSWVPLPQYYPVLVSSTGLPPTSVLSKIAY